MLLGWYVVGSNMLCMRIDTSKTFPCTYVNHVKFKENGFNGFPGNLNWVDITAFASEDRVKLMVSYKKLDVHLNLNCWHAAENGR